MEVEFPGRPLPTLQVLRPQWARWFDLVRRSDRNLVKWKYQLRSFNVRQDFGQRQVKENRNTLLAPRQTSDEDGDAQICDGETIMKLTLKFPEWEPQYKAALLEVDRAKLLERVAAAEAAIRQRMRAIFGRTDGDTERQAIGKALSALSVLKETLFY